MRRHLIIPACLCLAEWSSATASEPKLLLPDAPPIAASNMLSLGSSLSNEHVDPHLAPLRLPIIARSRQEICETLADAARKNDLPAPFLIRLLYQESSFRPGVISSAGAMGIAQFMRETATDRGLNSLRSVASDTSIGAPAARCLGKVWQCWPPPPRAAYNAGPKRIANWLSKRAALPQETEHYVKRITGWPAESWAAAQAGSPTVKLPQDAPCQEIAGLFASDESQSIPLQNSSPMESSKIVAVSHLRRHSAIC
jgi:Transglycosylase SLT domain